MEFSWGHTLERVGEGSRDILLDGFAHSHTHLHTQAQTRPHEDTQVHCTHAHAYIHVHTQLVASASRFLLQWSYGFYLIHLQGKQGFQFFCKTEDMKRKWMEQFEMAM